GSVCLFFVSSRRRHTRSKRDWSSDVCSSDLTDHVIGTIVEQRGCQNCICSSFNSRGEMRWFPCSPGSNQWHGHCITNGSDHFKIETVTSTVGINRVDEDFPDTAFFSFFYPGNGIFVGAVFAAFDHYLIARWHIGIRLCV